MQISNFQSATSPVFWKDLNPDLCITDFPFKSFPPASIPDTCIRAGFQNLKEEGYFQTQPVIPEALAARFAVAVHNVVAAGFPAVFSFVYDEFWGIVRYIERIFKPTLGENYRLSPGDMWIWHVDREGRSTGWGPHRDLFDTSSLRPDGSPRILTVWVPLTDASPRNGCMYVVPTHLDPHYPSRLNERSVAVDALQNIRALPAAAGSLLGWSPMILHWGGRHSGHPVAPRTSVAFYLNDGSPEFGGGLSARSETFLPFWYRLGAIAAMINLFDGSPLASDLRFPPAMKAVLQPYLDRVKSG